MPDSVRKTLDDALRARILVLDGAMGTMIQRRGLGDADFRGARFADHPQDLKGNNDLLVLTRPDVIEDIADEYLAAGADIVETNTFSGTSIAQGDYGLESVVHELNVEAARIAKRAAARWTARTPERPRYVAGAIGADQPDAVDFARRQRSDVPGLDLRRACAMPTSSRRARLIEGGVRLSC